MTGAERSSAAASRAGRERLLLQGIGGLLCALFAVAVVRAAWLCDDAYITLRSVDNLLHGLGPTWNPDERVQTFTHPLWMLLLFAVVGATGSWHVAPILLGAALSLVAFVRLLFGAPGVAGALLLGGGMLLSRAFIDYSTSGLENPLSHLLVAGFLGIHLRAHAEPEPDAARSLRRLGWLAALCALTRLDLLALVGPALATRAWRLGARRAVPALLPALLPLLAWSLFSLVYYGSLLPNTALAKLGTGIPLAARAAQGLHYLENSLRSDPLTLGAVALAAVSCGFPGARGRRSAALGVAAYLAWVVSVGGDFMSGRMLTLPLLGSLAIAAHSRPPGGRIGSLAPVALLLALGAAAPHPTWTNDARYPERLHIAGHDLLDVHGIADERGVFFPYTGLLRADPSRGPTDHPWAVEGRALREQGIDLAVRGAVGLLGFHAGPDVHVVDYMAICDPLLARLPVRRDRRLRIGHFERPLPTGYLPSLLRDENRIADAAVAACFDDVKRVTRGPLFAAGRWAAIVRLAGGGACGPELAAFVDGADPGAVEPRLAIRWESLRAREGRAPLELDGGIDVYLPGPRRPEALLLELGTREAYAVDLLHGLTKVAGHRLPLLPGAGTAALEPRRIELAPAAREAGFDRLRVIPLRREGGGLLGRVELVGLPPAP